MADTKRKDVEGPTGCEGYADVSLLFDTQHWDVEEREPAMEEAYRRLRRRKEEVRELRAALRDCELNLRVFHNATGQKEEWDPAVKPTFEVWKNARALLPDTEAEL